MKILLLDADGVVLKKDEYFSTKFARDYNLPNEDVLAFFKNEYGRCQSGDLDLKEVLPIYLSKWNWPGSVEDFLEYWFATDVVINDSIVPIVQKLRQAGVKCYLASNNEKYRAERIIQTLEGVSLLDGYYFSSKLKVKKNEPLFFTKILEDLGAEPSEIVYLDNDQVNLDSAMTLGIEAYLYSEEKMRELLK
jgi:putative hydrolase of the HAD superfamily